MPNILEDVIARRQLRIGADQRDLMARVLGAGAEVTAWDDGCRPGKVVIVDEPPRQLQVDGFCRSLPPATTVVIPRSENPAFDFLKSKLHRHGLIGACAPHSTHQIWWGGTKPRQAASTCQSILRSHLVSCVEQGTAQEETAERFEHSLDALGISHSIARIDIVTAYARDPDLRSRTLLAAWERTEKPLMWLDPNSTGQPPSVAVDLANADFAATLKPDGGVSTNFLYFGRTPVAMELLTTWNSLSREFPSLPADHLLDAAWSLVISQRLLVTLWLDPDGGATAIPGGKAASTLDPPPPDIDRPGQREARKAGRSAAPEPHCILNSRFGGRGPLTLTILSEGATARQTADTMASAVDAFFRYDGGFALLGIVICRSQHEVDDTVRKIGDGFFLCVQAGLVLEPTIFQSLHEKSEDRDIGLPLQRQGGPWRTSTGKAIALTRSPVRFLTAIPPTDADRPQRSHAPILKVV